MAAAKKKSKAPEPVEHICHQASLATAIETFLEAWFADESTTVLERKVNDMQDAYNKWKGDGQ